MIESQFIPKTFTKTIEKGSVTWQSPSNIALIKYWGKYRAQLPKNASISFTLSNCYTETTVSFEKKITTGFSFEVYLDDKRQESFEPKILQFFERVEVYLPFLKDYKFKIETSNNFPHSSGIASSASGMSALALCLVSIERSLSRRPEQSVVLSLSKHRRVVEATEQLRALSGVKQLRALSGVEMQKASFLARLGSGSACRSIEGDLVVWGKHKEIEGSSNLFGIKYPFDVHENFKNYQDTILLVDKGEKQVSSTVGHELMHNHPFAEQRFKQANDNLSTLIPILKNGDLSEFIKIVESEALSLHAMMMTSQPYFILMKPNTLEIINRIWAFRNETNSNVCFTLDAGANVHVLYPEAEKEEVFKFIKKELLGYCKNGDYICDQIGFGARLINSL